MNKNKAAELRFDDYMRCLMFCFSVELLCAAVTLASQLVVALVSSDHQVKNSEM